MLYILYQAHARAATRRCAAAAVSARERARQEHVRPRAAVPLSHIAARRSPRRALVPAGLLPPRRPARPAPAGREGALQRASLRPTRCIPHRATRPRKPSAHEFVRKTIHISGHDKSIRVRFEAIDGVEDGQTGHAALLRSPTRLPASRHGGALPVRRAARQHGSKLSGGKGTGRGEGTPRGRRALGDDNGAAWPTADGRDDGMNLSVGGGGMASGMHDSMR